MVFATGDTHGNFLRFRPENFPEQKNMTKSDYVIICGDFGGVWDGSRKERQTLDWLESLPFTVLFVSGNHENSHISVWLSKRQKPLHHEKGYNPSYRANADYEVR